MLLWRRKVSLRFRRIVDGRWTLCLSIIYKMFMQQAGTCPISQTYETGAKYHSGRGSGSRVMGLFSDALASEELAVSLISFHLCLTSSLCLLYAAISFLSTTVRQSRSGYGSPTSRHHQPRWNWFMCTISRVNVLHLLTRANNNPPNFWKTASFPAGDFQRPSLGLSLNMRNH